jgi:hypothetical protein
MPVENKTGLVRRFLWSILRGKIAVRRFLCFCIFTPFDTARRSDGTGRLHARRRIGYSGEQNGQSVLPVAAGCRLLQNQNRMVRAGDSILSRYASHYFLRQPTIFPDSPRWMLTPRSRGLDVKSLRVMNTYGTAAFGAKRPFLPDSRTKTNGSVVGRDGRHSRPKCSMS